MPRDLSDLLAEAAPRDPGSPDLAAIETRAARRRTGRVGAAVVAVLAAGALAVQAWPSTPDTPIVDEVEDGVVREDGTTVLPLPAPGEVTPAHANGRPVFVVHEDDGEVRVLDAISPHDSDPTALKVLAYCETSGWFEDPWHGSKFSDNGAWTGGPAPYGLATHAVLEVGADTVTVGALRSAPARGVLQGTEPAGPDCGETGAESGVRLDDLVVHADVTDVRVPGLLYPERPDDDCCGLLLPDDPQVAGDGEPVTISLPNAEDVAARHIGERPVFLVPRTFDASPTQVVVLDGVDPHQTGLGPPKVLAFCTDVRVQETIGFPRQYPGLVYDPWYLSRFSPVGAVAAVDGTQRAIPTGGWIGGPAPNGLARYPVLDVERGAGDALAVKVLPQRFPAPPRVDLGLDDVDDGAVERALRSLPSEDCSGRDQLFPDMPPADPTLLDDLALHEPLHPDQWWYPTPARLLGDEPGLPPDELERYLGDTAE